jgi:hypothetical protein
LHQHPCGRAQQQKLPTALAHAATLINDAAQNAKQLGHALHLIQDDQLLRMRHQKSFWVVQLPLRGRQFKV